MQLKKTKFKTSICTFIFKAPNVKHKDVPALDVLATILGQGDSSLLVKKLRLEKALVGGVSAFNYNPQDQGLFAISAQYQEEGQDPEQKFTEVASEILQQIDFVQNNPTSWNEIKRARVGISSEQFYSVETVDGLANKAGTLEFYLGDANGHKKYLAAINKITPEDVQKVAKKYLKLDQLSAAFMGSNEVKQSEKFLQTIPKMWKETIFAKKAEIAKSKKIAIPKLTPKSSVKSTEGGIEKIQLDSGIKLMMKQVSDLPTVSSKFIFQGGTRYETPETMGLSEFATRTWMGGTKTKSEAQLMQSIEEMAMGLSPFAGRNTFGFSLEYMSAFEKSALDMALEVMTEPIFSNEIIEREKQILAQQIKSKEDHPGSLCSRQFMQTMFPNHPLSYEAMGTLQTLPALGQKEILALRNKILNPAHLTVAVVGDFNKKDWIKHVENLEKQLHQGHQKDQKFTVSDLKKNERKFLEKDKEQSHVMIGWRSLSITDPERFTLQTIQAILAGQGGRLFNELRDKNSLAYSVAPRKMESLETGFFGGYIACSPEKVEKAIEMFQAEFKKLTTTKIPLAELQRAQRYLIGQHDIALQRKSALCDLIGFDEFYGNDYNQNLNIAAEYRKVTEQKIIDLSNRLFKEPYVVSIVGRA